MKRSHAPSQRGTLKTPLLPVNKFNTSLLPSKSILAVNEGNCIEETCPKRHKTIHHEADNFTLQPQPLIGSSTEEFFFAVTWRKQTNKKHKTWDGDGFLIVKNTTGFLKDKDGQNIGTVKNLSVATLEIGRQLVGSGKEVEIVEKLDAASYRSGQASITSVPLAPDVSDSISQKVVFTKFKKVIPEQNMVNKVATPRHDPNVTGSIVLPRPSIDHQRLYNPRKRPLVDVVIDPILSQRMRPHQHEGVQSLYECVMDMRPYDGQGAMLADEMGLGKTLQVIALLWTLIKQTPYFGDSPIVKRALIVCPVTLIKNWHKEFKKWLGDERIRPFVVDSKSNIKDFLYGRVHSVMIIGYEKLRSIQESLKDAQFDIVVCDEGHRLKSQNIKISQALRSIPSRKRIILSGTPLQNDLGEFHAMIDFINPDVLGQYSIFKKTFQEPILRSRQPGCTSEDVDLGKSRSEELTQLTSLFIIRRTVEVLSEYLPPKLEQVIFCRPSSLQLDIYSQLLREDLLQKCTSDGSQILRAITTLKKLCNSPSLLLNENKSQPLTGSLPIIHNNFEAFPPDFNSEKYSSELSGKLFVLDKFLSNLKTLTSEKIVLVSHYTQTLNVLEQLCNRYQYRYFRLDGSTPQAERQELVNKFNSSNSDKFVFLLSSKSGGTGISLIGASRIILFDIDWNPSIDLQAMARIYRDGQKQRTYIYRLLTTGSIEEKIYQRQLIKQKLNDSLMDHKDNAVMNQFSSDELRDLFSLHIDTRSQTHDLLKCDCLDETTQNPESHFEKPIDTKFHQSIIDSDSLVHQLCEWNHVLPDAAVDYMEDGVLAQTIRDLHGIEEKIKDTRKTVISFLFLKKSISYS